MNHQIEKDQLDLFSYSEKFSNKFEALKQFIGKRDTKHIHIETYDFKKLIKNMNNNPKFVDKALTMQKALETAYSDWYKEKQQTNLESQNDLTKNVLPMSNFNASTF